MFQHVIFISIYFLILCQLFVRCKSAEIGSNRCSGSIKNSCKLIHNTMTLRCDQSNFRTIPDPNLVRNTRAAPYKAEFLYVNQSCLTWIDKEMLLKYTRLLTLDLCSNQIEKIDDNTFAKLKKLTRLHLSDNSISSIDEQAFNGLTLLLHLNLDNNKLQTLSSKLFEKVVYLRVLKLNNNMLQSIPEAVLSKLTSLEFLDLSGNNLHHLHPRHFKGMAKLRTLNLNNNDLEEFDKAVFLSASSIEHLDLSKNNIKCLEKDTFEDQNLSKLQLLENPLSTAQSYWFLSLIEMYKSKPDLFENRFLSQNGTWTCDCKANAYRIFLTEWIKETTLRSTFDIRCSAPESVKGKMLSGLTWEDISLASGCDDRDEEVSCSSAVVDVVAMVTTTMVTEITVESTTQVSLRLQDSAENQTNIFNKTAANLDKLPLQQNPSIEFEWKTYLVMIVLFACVVVFAISMLIVCKRRLNKEANKKTEVLSQPNVEAAALAENKSSTAVYFIEKSSREDALYDTASSGQVYERIEETKDLTNDHSSSFSRRIEANGVNTNTSHPQITSEQQNHFHAQNIDVGMTSHQANEPVYVIGYYSAPVAQAIPPSYYIQPPPAYIYPYSHHAPNATPLNDSYFVYNPPQSSQLIDDYINSTQIQTNPG